MCIVDLLNNKSKSGRTFNMFNRGEGEFETLFLLGSNCTAARHQSNHLPIARYYDYGL